MNEDTALDTLFSSPPEEFVELRDRLARELRAQGQEEAAQGLKSLRRPTRVAWGLNQLARREAKALRALLAAGDALRAAAQAGGGAPLRAAHRAHRREVEALTVAAGALLQRAGHPPSNEALRQIRATLEAASAAGEAERERLLRGRLVAPLEPPSLLEVLGSLETVRPAPSPPASRPRVDRRREALQLQAGRAEQEAQALRVAAERAGEQARRLEEEARRAEARARGAREQARQAAAAAASASALAGQARAKARAARAELERASGAPHPGAPG